MLAKTSLIRAASAAALTVGIVANPLGSARATTNLTPTNGAQTLGVSITVTPSCSVAVTAIAFGSVAASAVPSATAQGTITPTCTTGTTFYVALDQGAGGAGGAVADANPRYMKGADNSTYLAYGLFQDAGVTLWGNTPTTNTPSYASTGVANAITVYAVIPAGTSGFKAQSYSDSVNVTISY